VIVEQDKMTSLDSQGDDLTSPTELDFECSSNFAENRQRRDPDVESLQHGERRASQASEVRRDVPDSRDDKVARRVSLKLDHQTRSFSADEDEDAEIPATQPDTTEPEEAERPLSSGWAAALAAASAAGSIRAAAKRRTNVGRSNTFVPPPTRSLLCLSLTNPLRKLTISIVEWKYPLRRQLSQHHNLKSNLKTVCIVPHITK